MISGNESLTDERGFTAGSFIIYNSGIMSTSNGPKRGYSKALPLSYVWFNCYIPFAVAINFGGAWTSVSMDSFTLARLPITMALAEAVESVFWVSFQHFLTGDNFNISRLASMISISTKLSCLVEPWATFRSQFSVIGYE